jgi:hypothetical protein
VDERSKIDSRLGHGEGDIGFSSLYFNINYLDFQEMKVVLTAYIQTKEWPIPRRWCCYATRKC